MTIKHYLLMLLITMTASSNFITFKTTTASPQQSKATCIITTKYHVYVANNLGPNTPPLLAHCASGDAEKGNQTIALGKYFDWSFCEGYFERTLYFCHLRWGSKDKSFDVFSSKTKKECYNYVCYWEARPDGIYFSGEYPPKDLKKREDWVG